MTKQEEKWIEIATKKTIRLRDAEILLSLCIRWLRDDHDYCAALREEIQAFFGKNPCNDEEEKS